MTATTTAPKITVASLTWDAVTLLVDGQRRNISWERLRAAAQQQDQDLARVYRGVLAQAVELATRTPGVRVVIRNQGGHHQDLGAHTWAAEIRNLAGELVTGRTIGAEWGQQGTFAQALADADRGRRGLARKAGQAEPEPIRQPQMIVWTAD